MAVELCLVWDVCVLDQITRAHIFERCGRSRTRQTEIRKNEANIVQATIKTYTTRRRSIHTLPLAFKASRTGRSFLVAFHMTRSAYSTAKCRVSEALVVGIQHSRPSCCCTETSTPGWARFTTSDKRRRRLRLVSRWSVTLRHPLCRANRFTNDAGFRKVQKARRFPASRRYPNMCMRSQGVSNSKPIQCQIAIKRPVPGTDPVLGKSGFFAMISWALQPCCGVSA